MLVLVTGTASAGVALFASATDTIQASSGTTLMGAATIEARVLYNTAHHDYGFVFDEWTNGAEDKVLTAGPGHSPTMAGGAYPNPIPLQASPTIALDVWHHIAMVFDGSATTMNLYLDGTLVGSVAASLDVANDVGLPHIGAMPRDYTVYSGLIGYVDWLRVSDIARYSGTSFAPPSSQPVNDANTQLLYYFDEAPGSTTIADQSSFHRDGTVGVGFAGATSPVLTFDPLSPPSIGDVNGDGSINVGDVFYLINDLFAGGPAPVGPADVNGDGAVNVGDVFYLINYLFAGGPAPVLPPATLNVTVNGLPGGVNAMVKVYGPSGYDHTTIATESLAGLTPGDYTIAPSGVWATGQVYQAGGGLTATLASGETDNVTITYAAVPGLTIQIPDASNPGSFVPMEFVQVPAGSYTMGSDDPQDNWSSGVCQPTHTVTFSQPFYLSKTEVTQAQWRAVMNTNPSSFVGDTLPVDSVSWDSIRVSNGFLDNITAAVPGYTFRLPSEAEWEYACRAGTTTGYSFGDDVTLLSNYAWYTDVSGFTNHPVATKLANPWGLYDMHGNVWEWCEDDFHWSYSGAPTDGSPWVDAPRGSVRTVRSAGWIYGPAGTRSAYRQRDTSSLGYQGRGFRLVLVAQGSTPVEASTATLR